MIKTQVGHKTENTPNIQGFNALYEKINGPAATVEAESNSGDEFSNLMDKIAARFSENLGFDFASLLSSGAVQAEAKIVKEPVKAKEPQEKKEEKASESSDSSFVAAKISTEVKVERKQVDSKESKVQEEKEVKKSSDANCETTQAIAARTEAHNQKAAEKVSAEVKVEVKGEVKVVTGAKQETAGHEVIELSEDAVVKSEVVAKEAAKIVKASEKPVSEEVDGTKTEVAVDAEVQVAAAETGEQAQGDSQTTSTPSDEQTAEQKDAAAAKDPVAKAAVSTNAALLADMFLTSTFISKELGGAQGAQSAASNSQSVKNITEALRDKIVNSMNNALSNQNVNMSGNFSVRANSAKPEIKEKPSLQQPQMFKAFEKVESALKEAAKARDGKTISLRLDPPDLGTVKVDVSLKDGSLHARINADSQTINTLLKEHSQDLQQALRKLGLNVDTITVSVNGSEQTDIGQNFSGNFENAMADKNQQDSAAGFESENNFNINGEAFVQAETNTIDHWVA